MHQTIKNEQPVKSNTEQVNSREIHILEQENIRYAYESDPFEIDSGRVEGEAIGFTKNLIFLADNASNRRRCWVQ